MPAYSVLETDEFTGGIIFAKSNIAARKIGARVFNHDDMSGLQVKRRKDLDQYEGQGVPASLLVSQGWYFECHGCGMTINSDNMDEEGLPVRGIVGSEGGPIYCCHACRMDSRSKESARDAFGQAFLDMLRDIVMQRLPDIDHRFEEQTHHVYVSEAAPWAVVQARVSFSFAGMSHGPASLRYDHSGPNGQSLIGPVRPEFYCCNGDKEAFEKICGTGEKND